MRFETLLNHPKEIRLPDGNYPIITPIYQSAKFQLARGVPGPQQFLYSRISNPNLTQLEQTLAAVQKKETCVVFASGIAAISSLMLGILKSGDHVITFRETYKPGRVFIRDVLPRYGIESSVLSIQDLAGLEKAIRPNTRLIFFESPTNPNLVIADVEHLSKIAKKHHCLLAMDATFGGLHQHTEFGIDLLLHSLTKYANGHGDVIAGSVAGSQELIRKIRTVSDYLGAALDPHAAFLIQRGLKTYELRYARYCENTKVMAEYLRQHPKVKRVFYPGFESDPGHALAKKQMRQMGAVVSFEIDPACGTAVEFCYKVSLIQCAASLGSTETLMVPSKAFFGDDLSEHDRSEMGLTDYTLRLSLGLEHPDDLKADLEKAFTLP